MEYLQKKYTSPDGIIDEEIVGDDGSKQIEKIYTGDLLEQYRRHIQNHMFYGYDFDVTMLRIAAMNMMLHGVDNPNIEYMDTLSNRFVEDEPKASSNYFDLILANPPFKGSLDAELVHKSLTGAVQTKRLSCYFPY